MPPPLTSPRAPGPWGRTHKVSSGQSVLRLLEAGAGADVKNAGQNVKNARAYVKDAEADVNGALARYNFVGGVSNGWTLC